MVHQAGQLSGWVLRSKTLCCPFLLRNKATKMKSANINEHHKDKVYHALDHYMIL